jgi:hypothetical protein
MRWIVAAVVGVALLLGAGGMAFAHFRTASVAVASVLRKPSTCQDAYKLLALRPSQITAAHSVCLVQSLKFTGELAGTVGHAYPVNADDMTSDLAPIELVVRLGRNVQERRPAIVRPPQRGA